MKVQNAVTTAKISEVMTRKVITIMADDSVQDAVNLMMENELSAIPVVGYQDECVGILSQSDLTELFLAEDDELSRVLDTPRLSMEWLFRTLDTCEVRRVKELMSPQVNTIGQDQTLVDACDAFVKHKIHHLPVIDGAGKVVGMLSTFDIVKALSRNGA
jgi:CBS-domain-containing membrane protein